MTEAFHTAVYDFQQNAYRDPHFCRTGVLRQDPQITKLCQALQDIAWIVGGAARFVCSPQMNLPPAGDVDVFLRQPTSKARIEAILGELGYQKTSDGRLASTWMNATWKRPVQVVLPRTEKHLCSCSENPEDILQKLDFSVCRALLLSPMEALVDVDFLKDEIGMRLSIKHIVCPLTSVRRIAKYTAKGYKISMGEILKLFAEWSERATETETETAAEVTPTQILQMFTGDETEFAMKVSDDLLSALYMD